MKFEMSRVRSIARLLLCFAVGLSLIGVNSVARADDMAYLATGGGAFGTIDLNTGVFTQLGLSAVLVVGLAVIGTTLYGAGQGSGNQSGQLYSVDPANGLLTAIGQPTGIQYTAFGSLNNTLYAIDSTSANPNLYSINSSTGAATLIGHLNIAPLAGYYSLSNNATALYFQLNSTLYTLNTATGQASAVGPLGDSPPANAFQVGGMVEVNGTLYAGQDNNSVAPLEILALNTSTGAATVVSQVTNSPGSNVSYIFALAPIISSFAASSTFFPQVAVGGGLSTSFMLPNTGSTTISGNLILTNQQGKPWTVSTSSGEGSSFPVSILPGGTQFLTINPLNPNDSVTVGYASVETSGGAPGGVATYQSASGGVTQYAAGVLSSQPMQFATIPVNENRPSLSTALAIANPTSQSLEVKLALVDPNGTVENDILITLPPEQQTAAYLYQIYQQQQVNLPTTFQGSVVLRAQGGGTFVAVALVQNQQIWTAIPVISGKAPNIPD